MPHAIEKAIDTIANGLKGAPIMAHAEMQEAVDAGAQCAECGILLCIMWGGHYGCNCYILSCGDIGHTMTKKVERKTKPEIEGEKVFRGYTLKLLSAYTPDEMVARANSVGLFPQTMTVQQKQAIAQICVEYSLDPLMREVMIYQGAPYITMAARLRKAQEAPMPLAGISTRPASEPEKIARGYTNGDYVMVAEAYKLCGDQRLGPYIGWGIVKQAEIDRNVASAKSHGKRADALPLVNDPAQHAEKRAISRSLRMGWHIPLPTFEDIGEDGNGADAPKITIIEPDDKSVADQSDGPKATAKETAAAEAKPAATAAPASEPTGKPNGKPNGAPLVIPPTTYGELKAIVHARQPEIKLGAIDGWIAKTTGMGSDGLIADPVAAYTELKALCGWTELLQD